jgi:hypothetical protein
MRRSRQLSANKRYQPQKHHLAGRRDDHFLVETFNLLLVDKQKEPIGLKRSNGSIDLGNLIDALG